MAKILAIHGAFSTPRMFNYLKNELKEHTWEFIDYRDKIDNITDVIDLTKSYMCHEQYHLIGHSMGGLIALALANEERVSSVVTIATPLGGLDINLLQSYLSRSHFLSEIANNSKFIRQLHAQKVNKPTLHLITTHGFNPYIYEQNDGVVTVRSQKRWQCGQTYEILANHSEVLLHEDTVNQLKIWLD
jgi:triacylglycerol esterase/lipase EstA (alpha/beta hydrolase family)